MAAAAAERARGNALFSSGDAAGAKAAYDSGFMELVVTKDEWDGVDGTEAGGGAGAVPGLSPADKAEVSAEKARLHGNRAACNLKLGRAEPARWDCDRCLDFDKAVGTFTGHRPAAPDERRERGGGGGEEEEGPPPPPPHRFLPGQLANKARRRKAAALVALVREELARGKSPDGSSSSSSSSSSSKRFSDVSKAAKLAASAARCLDEAEASLRAPSGDADKEAATVASELAAVAKARVEVGAVIARVERAQASQDVASAGLFKKIIAGLDRTNSRAVDSEAPSSAVPDSLSDMPELDDSDQDE